MQNKVNKLSLAISAGIAASVLSAPVIASGFQVREQSAKTLANAWAGSAAGAEDASFMVYNPAAIGNIDGTQFVGSISYIDANFELKDGQASSVFGVPYSSNASGEGGESALVPSFAVKTQLSERLDLGLAIYAPYGLSTKYDEDWIGRYHGVETELKTIDIQPTLNYRFSDRLSLAAGLRAEYADATLSNALDLPTIGASQQTDPATAAALAGQGGQHDGFAEVTGDDWGYGYTLGALFQATERTRLGIGYRSEIDIKLDGEAEFSADDATGQAILRSSQTGNTFTNGGGSAELTTPANLNLGVYHQLTDRLAVMANAEWTEWSSFDELVVDFDDNTPNSVTEEHWNDTWAFSVGANYALNDRWLLRAGLGYDESPVPDSRHRTPRVPDSDRRWLSVGATFTPTEHLDITAGYLHVFANDVDMDLSATDPGNASRGNLSGRYEVAADVFALSTSYRF